MADHDAEAFSTPPDDALGVRPRSFDDSGSFDDVQEPADTMPAAGEPDDLDTSGGSAELHGDATSDTNSSEEWFDDGSSEVGPGATVYSDPGDEPYVDETSLDDGDLWAVFDATEEDLAHLPPVPPVPPPVELVSPARPTDELPRPRPSRPARAVKSGLLRRRWVWIVAAVALLAVSAVAVMWLVRSSQPESDPEAPARIMRLRSPITVGDTGAAVTVTIVQDYLCGECGEFSRTNSTVLDDLVASGKGKVVLFPIAVLDRLSNDTKWSTRTANAILTVAELAPERLLAFNTTLFANQPAEDDTNDDPTRWSDARIRDLALVAGVPADVADTFIDMNHSHKVAELTAATTIAGVRTLPTILINGEPFTGRLSDAGAFAKALTPPAPTPTPEGTPSETPSTPDGSPTPSETATP